MCIKHSIVKNSYVLWFLLQYVKAKVVEKTTYLGFGVTTDVTDFDHIIMTMIMRNPYVRDNMLTCNFKHLPEKVKITVF